MKITKRTASQLAAGALFMTEIMAEGKALHNNGGVPKDLIDLTEEAWKKSHGAWAAGQSEGEAEGFVQAFNHWMSQDKPTPALDAEHANIEVGELA